MGTRSPSTRTALFLGAGASKEFQFPLTSELLPIVRERLKSGELFNKDERDERKTLVRFLESVLPGYSEMPDAALPLITELLSLLDYAIASGHAYSDRVPRRLQPTVRALIERAIYEALDWDVDFDPEPPSLRQTVQWLASQFDDDDQTIGILSTNYDSILEVEMFDRIQSERAVECDFGFGWRHPYTGNVISRPTNPRMGIYRLHGALTLLYCPRCDHTYLNVDGSIANLGYRSLESVDTDNTCHCEYGPLEPVMIAPSSVRDIRNSSILEVWRHSGEFLRTAGRWIIVGYSFPPEDLGIRSMFARALAGSDRADGPEILIVQASKDPATMRRYRSMFPDARYTACGMGGLAGRLGTLEKLCEDAPTLHELLG